MIERFYNFKNNFSKFTEIIDINLIPLHSFQFNEILYF